MDLVHGVGGVSNMTSVGSDGTTGDTGYFAGGRLSAVNTTRDGFVVSDGRYNHGAFSITYTSPDLVEEVRVITAPVDAEVGRGSGQVQTAQARQGIYRFFPGVDNQNATQNNPTVDRKGNPVLNGQPATPQPFSVFNRDQNRPGFDTSGWIQKVLARMPQPNDYTMGDGLNTAGFRWTRRINGLDNFDGSTFDQTNRDQVNIRIDHNFNTNHKASVIYTW